MSTTEYIMFWLSVTCFGFIVGWYTRELYAKWVVRRLSKEVWDNLQNNLKQQHDNTIEVEITKVEGGYIVHRTTGEFLVQGTSHEEISEKLNKLYPGYSFSATPENLAAVGYPGHESV